MTASPRARLLSTALPLAAIAIATIALVRPDLPGAPTAHARMADDAEHPIAICSIPMLVNEVMRSDRFTAPMEEMQEDYRAQFEAIEEEATEIRDSSQGLDPSSPAYQEAGRRHQALFRKASELEREMSQRMAQLTAEQIVDAYTQVRAAAKEIAEDLGYEYLIAAASEDEELPKVNPDQTLRQMLARPCVLWPDGVDITDEVRDDLNL